MKYKTIEQLQRHKAQLLETVQLSSQMQLAAWKNQYDLVNVCSDHHTLSLYIEGGYKSYRKTNHGWRNGGSPGRFCLMPAGQESAWDIRDHHLSFVHLYYTDQHLRHIATQIWDKEPNVLELQEKSFAEDQKIKYLYHHFLLKCDWLDRSNSLQLSSTTHLLLNHLLQHYTNVHWQLPKITGGLAPYHLKHLKEWIHQNLHSSITLSDLATQIELSEYHFARMFKHSVGISPHQYVLQQRLERAHQLILNNSSQDLTTIALLCGFSSPSHFSTRFKHYYHYTPSQLRQK